MSALVKTLTQLKKAPLADITCKKPFSSCAQKPTGSSESTKVNYSKRMIKLKKLQEHFQRDDGRPIFLKRGTADRLLYLSTLGLGIFGVILDLKYYASYIFSDK